MKSFIMVSIEPVYCSIQTLTETRILPSLANQYQGYQ